MAFQIRSAAFGEGENIPRRHTCDGENLSPALDWSGAPPFTKSFAIICDDPDAPGGVWTHWTVFDISSGVKSIAEGYRPQGTVKTGTNDFGKSGYGGPCPPKGHGPHRYFFKLFALDIESTRLHAGARRDDLNTIMRAHTIAEARCMGRYERK